MLISPISCNDTNRFKGMAILLIVLHNFYHVRNSVDLIENDDELYVGRGGNMGDRPGNFAVQNSDLVIAIGVEFSFTSTSSAISPSRRTARLQISVSVAMEKLQRKKKGRGHSDARPFRLSRLDEG